MSSLLSSQNGTSTLKLAPSKLGADDQTKSGPQKKVTSRANDSALLSAARQGDLDAVKGLLAAGADANAQDGEGWTALMMATVQGHLEVGGALLDAGADLHLKNNNGWSALRFAVSMDDTEAVRLLLDMGADVNDKDSEGNTALMQAAGEKSMESINLLLAHGADADIRNRAGETALSIASRHGYPEIVELLDEGGAEVRSVNLSHRIASEELFSEGELQQLIEKIDGLIPEKNDGLVQFNDDSAADELQVMDSNALSLDVMERLASALEALRAVAQASNAPHVSVTDMAHKLMLSLQEAAVLSGLSRRHLRQAMKEGELQARKIGQGWRIKRADLEAYVEKL
jgi:excisionase family DNA binding protein